MKVFLGECSMFQDDNGVDACGCRNPLGGIVLGTFST
jgi:hypothetical protein